MRDELALKLASRTLWPLLGNLSLEIAVVLLLVKRALQPVITLSRSLSARSLETLMPIDMGNAVSAEVEPLVGALSDLLIRLDKALEVQRVFVADAAHELRTPLTALKLRIQVAWGDPSATSNGELFRKLEERVNRAIHLVQQLLTLAREGAQTSLMSGTADLRRVVSQVISELSVLA